MGRGEDIVKRFTYTMTFDDSGDPVSELMTGIPKAGWIEQVTISWQDGEGEKGGMDLSAFAIADLTDLLPGPDLSGIMSGSLANNRLFYVQDGSDGSLGLTSGAFPYAFQDHVQNEGGAPYACETGTMYLVAMPSVTVTGTATIHIDIRKGG